MILSIQRVDEAVASKFVHAHARNACEVQLPEARLTLVVLLHVPALQGYAPVRLVHVDRQPATGQEEGSSRSTSMKSTVEIIGATATNITSTGVLLLLLLILLLIVLVNLLQVLWVFTNIVYLA